MSSDGFIESRTAKTFEELSAALKIPEQELRLLQSEVVSISKGPPFEVGKVLFELLAKRKLTTDELMHSPDLLKAIESKLIITSVNAAEEDDFIEDLFEDEDLGKIVQAGEFSKLPDAIKMSGGVARKSWAPVGRNDRLAIAVARPKSAALFFDRVWTLDRDIPGSIGFRCDNPIEKVALGFLEGLAEEIGEFMESDESERAKMIDELLPEFVMDENVEPVLGKAISSLIQPSIQKLSNAPVQSYFASENTLKGVYEPGLTSMVVAVIDRLDWIDEGSLTWDQVNEVRNDSESMLQLKRMLNWLNRDMAGKSATELADEIQFRVEDYRRATNKHGIKLCHAAMGTFLDVGLITSILLPFIAGKEFDEEKGGAIGMVTGLAVHGLRVLFDTYKVHVDLKSGSSSSPIAYLHRVERKVR